mmetsp:Transcript_20946/g.32445  ORF Transcript_20946/g.32445 Transcript_20946/m.32445 type:complete len:108 (-) Transcript_20946:200-523(-)
MGSIKLSTDHLKQSKKTTPVHSDDEVESRHGLEDMYSESKMKMLLDSSDDAPLGGMDKQQTILEDGDEIEDLDLNEGAIEASLQVKELKIGAVKQEEPPSLTSNSVH